MREFTSAQGEWVADYSSRILEHFGGVFAPHSGTFRQADVLLGRISQARDSVLNGGWGLWSSMDEAHNELCVAAAILESPGYRINRLEYEPPSARGGPTIDFLATGSDGRPWLVDVKTIAPILIDRWHQFERAKANGWLPQGADLILSRQWLGGELWHLKVASRSRMLEYTLELEDKLSGYTSSYQPDTTILMFCTNGFNWHEDELEDFVAFYADGEHRPDDPLAEMERRFIRDKGLDPGRRVKRFGYLQRQSQNTVASRVNWCVRPPRFPSALIAGSAV
jgi:hypothetical protein